DRAPVLAGLAEHGQTTHAREQDLAQDQVVRFALESAVRLLAGTDEIGGVAAAAENAADRAAKVFVRRDQQDATCGGRGTAHYRQTGQQKTCHDRGGPNARKTVVGGRGRRQHSLESWQNMTGSLLEVVFFELAVEALPIDSEHARR